MKRSLLMLPLLLGLAGQSPSNQPSAIPAGLLERIREAFVAAQRGDFQTALADYGALLQEHDLPVGARAGVYFYRGQILANQHQVDAAIADFGEAIKLTPTAPQIHTKRGLAYMEKGDNQRAIVDYDAEINLGTADDITYGARAFSYENMGDYAHALPDREHAVKVNSANADANYALGDEYSRLDQLDRAVDYLNAAIRLNPRHVRAYLSRGLVHYKKGEMDAAIADATAAMRIDPTYEAAWHNLGQAHYYVGRKKEAITELSQAIRLTPGDATAFLYRGRAYEDTGSPKDAVADLSESIRLDPRNIASYIYRGAAYADLKQYDLAVSDDSKAIAIDSKSADAWVGRALAKIQKQDLAGANADLDAALVELPDNTIILITRALLLRMEQRYGEAVGNYSRIIEIDPKAGAAYLNRGIAYFCLGQFQEASADFRKYQALQPSNPWGVLWAYVTRLKLGDGDTARLAADRAGMTGANWLRSVADMFLGKTEPASVEKSAAEKDARLDRDDNPACETAFYLGEYAVAHNDASAARRYFSQSDPSTCLEGEAVAAAAELKRLPAP